MSELKRASNRGGRVWWVLTILAGVFLIAFGGLVVGFGQADDSPGLGGLGLITATIGLVMLVRVVLARRVR